ncbi:DUF3592 domain-containing protein [Streptomyces sp. NBC_00690]|uniref:DUF3592 domain-containing protein n=1 Tax=Streptomyces sp. NBC_00690 TaxID=2975808 RepID=UPI002E2CF528|nr:DUF3592 domain-containing protein [Streptomyces sp. NBC_00690]
MIGRGRLRAGAVTGLVLLLYGGVWFLGGLSIADLARHPVGSLYLTPDTEPSNGTPGLLWASFVALFLGPMVHGSARSALAHGWGGTPASVVPLAVFGTSVGTGFCLGAGALWVLAPDPGTDVDGAGRRGVSWGPGEWAAWTAQWWAPLLLLAFVVVRILVIVAASARESHREARAHEVMAGGVCTTGRVIEVSETGTEVGGRPRIRFVVVFTDRGGTDRRVTRYELFDRSCVPQVRDGVTVWFDPEDPDDHDAISVAGVPAMGGGSPAREK